MYLFIFLCCIVYWEIRVITSHTPQIGQIQNISWRNICFFGATYATNLFKTQIIYIVELGHRSWLRVIYLYFEPDSLGKCSGKRKVMVITEIHYCLTAERKVNITVQVCLHQSWSVYSMYRLGVQCSNQKNIS